MRGIDPSGEPPVERGEVVELAGDIARVRPHHHAACEACGASSWCFPDSRPSPLIDAANACGAHVGDIVSLRREEAPRIGAALTVFGLPVATTIGGAIVGISASGQEVQGGVAGSFAGLAFGMLLVRFINKFASTSARLRPQVDEILETQTGSG